MTPNLKIFALTASIAFLALIVELVRRRKLREEYSAVYLIVGMAILLLVVRFEFLLKLTRFLDATVPTSVLFLFALLFLLVMSLQYAVKLSKLTNDVKNLAQKAAILDAELQTPRGNKTDPLLPVPERKDP